MVGKSNRPPIEIIEDDGWLEIIFRQGCTGTSASIPDDKEIMQKIIVILQNRIASGKAT